MQLKARIKMLEATDLAPREHCRTQEEEMEEIREALQQAQQNSKNVTGASYANTGTQTAPATSVETASMAACQRFVTTSPTSSIRPDDAPPRCQARTPPPYSIPDEVKPPPSHNDAPTPDASGPTTKPSTSSASCSKLPQLPLPESDLDTDAGITTLTLSSEPPMCMGELKAWEESIYQAKSAAERGRNFGWLKEEVQRRGMVGLAKGGGEDGAGESWIG
jgi:hypothetical protein